MGRKKRADAKTTAPVEEPGGGLGGLAAALAAGGFQASTQPAQAEPSPPKPAAEGDLKGKAVVRRERKGRGGKTVTIVDGRAIETTDRHALAKAMRRGLGTGARIEDGRIVLQGDLRTAVAAWLERRGATVVLGN